MKRTSQLLGRIDLWYSIECRQEYLGEILVELWTIRSYAGANDHCPPGPLGS